MEVNTSVGRLLCDLLDNFPDDERNDIESFSIKSPRTTQELSIDRLLSARDSLEKYPLPIQNLFDELADLEGFSEELVRYIVCKVDQKRMKYSNNENGSFHINEVTEENHISGNDERSKLFRFLENMARNDNSLFEITLLVDSRERVKAESLYFHLTKDFHGNSSKSKSHGKQSERSFDELLHQFLDASTNEHRREQFPKKRATQAQQKFEYSVKEALLPIGDMLWVAKDTFSTAEVVLPLIVERKTNVDLASSLVDGRFHVQAERIYNCGLPWCLYIIEGCLDDTPQTSIPNSALRTAAQTLIQRYQFHVYNTNNLRETLLLLKHISRCLMHLISSYRFFDSLKNYSQCSYVEWTVEVQKKDVHRKKSQCFYSMLSLIDGVGPEAALKVSTTFETPFRLFNHFREVFLAFGEIHAEFCLTTYREEQKKGCKPVKLCSGAASSAIYKAFYSD